MKNKRIFLIILIIFILILISRVAHGSEKLVIDTDAGADDATGILLALSAWANNDSNFDVVAITCVYGNTQEKNVEQNVLKVLTIANVSNIPVYGGAQKPLMQEMFYDDFFGHDGFGDFKFNHDINIEVDNSTHAAVALVNLAKQYSGKLNVLVLGPLTNIAIAISLDPNFVNNVKKFYIMGGSVAGLGNKTPGVEYNFGCDPDSVYIVLNSIKKKSSIMYPWETAMNAVISSEWRINTLGSINSTIIDLLNNAEQKSLNRNYTNWAPSDAMIAAIMIWPELSRKSVITHVIPVNDGAAKGSLLVDYSDITGKAKNVEIIQNFDVEKFQSLLVYYFS